MAEPLQNFICIGAQKAGTTTLADILSAHPQICIPPIKETKFFLFDENYKKGPDFYNSYFTNYKDQLAVGEFDPDYLLFPFTAQRIYDTLGKDVRILVVLRNPADRAYSHYLMTRKKGLEPFTFSEAIKKEASRRENIKTQKIYAYTERGLYGKQIEAFMQVFPAANFHFLVFEEDFMRNRRETIRKVQSFLHVDEFELELNVHSNEAGEAKNEAIRNLVRRPNFAKRIVKHLLPSGEARKSIRKFFIRKNTQKASAPKLNVFEQRKIIDQYFIDDIHLTEKLINRDLSVWYK